MKSRKRQATCKSQHNTPTMLTFIRNDKRKHSAQRYESSVKAWKCADEAPNLSRGWRIIGNRLGEDPADDREFRALVKGQPSDRIETQDREEGVTEIIKSPIQIRKMLKFIFITTRIFCLLLLILLSLPSLGHTFFLGMRWLGVSFGLRFREVQQRCGQHQ